MFPTFTPYYAFPNSGDLAPTTLNDHTSHEEEQQNTDLNTHMLRPDFQTPAASAGTPPQGEEVGGGPSEEGLRAAQFSHTAPAQSLWGLGSHGCSLDH